MLERNPAVQQERVLRLRSARALWRAAESRPPRLADDDWQGPAAELYRAGEAELRSLAAAAGEALDEAFAHAVAGLDA